ncbi:F-box domain-containing protein [Mycena kentingensis (nom. inval.)]|nr:F-box domain-containing protein [Mycena kentingensis (nom. inval.)]
MRDDGKLNAATTLPTEIVCEAFTQYLPPYLQCPPMLGDLSPTKLTRSWGRWRAIAHAMLTLWTPLGLGETRQRHLPAGKEGTHPDNTALDAFELDEPAAGWLKPTFPLAIRNRRCRLRSYLDARLGGYFPELVEAHFAGYSEPGLKLFYTIHAPNLRNLSIELCVYDPLSAFAPWAQLTQLFLTYAPLDDASKILRATRVLRLCDLVSGNLDLVQDSEESFNPVELPHLQSLIIRSYDRSTDAAAFLHALRAPKLARLFIEHDVLYRRGQSLEAHAFGLRVLPSAIGAISCELEVLHIKYCPEPLEDYRVALTPCTRNLVLNSGNSFQDLSAEVWGRWDLNE